VPAYFSAKPRIRAHIGGTIDATTGLHLGGAEFPVVQFDSHWAVNQIPQASLLLAAGRRMDDQTVSPVHDKLDVITAGAKVWVYHSRLGGESWGLDDGLPDDDATLVFYGRVAGSGWQRATNAGLFTVNLLHWLAALDYSAAISASSHPGNPGDWTYPAHHAVTEPGKPANSTVRAQAAYIPTIHSGVDPFNDLWGDVLFKWINTHIYNDPFDRVFFGPPQANTGPPEEILDAVRRIQPGQFSVPLLLADRNRNGLVMEDSSLIRDGIKEHLEKESGQSWITNTLWGKIVGDWAPSFWLQVIPRVRDALIVPATGGIRQSHMRLDDGDETGILLSGHGHRRLRGVGIVFPMGSFSGARLVYDATRDLSGLCGAFVADGVTSGVFMIKEPPVWLGQPVIGANFGRSGTGVNTPITTPVDGPIGGNSPPDTGPGRRTQQRILDNFAEDWFALEMLKDRVGSVVTKLRFDIAPGTHLQVETGRATNIANHTDQLVSKWYGMVQSVSIHIDTATPSANTVLQLVHLRTEAENNNRTIPYAVDRPALYQIPWLGGPLITDDDPPPLKR
jgi:hypothetical protein